MKITGIIRFALLLIIGVQLACSGENGSNPSEPPISGSKEVSFSSPVSYSVGTGPPADLAIADFDGDQIPDIVTTNQHVPALPGFGGVSVLKGNGDGTFALVDTVLTNPSGIAIEAADFNSDGNADFVISTQTGYNVGVYLGDGMGKFPSRIFYSISSGTGAIAVDDLNGDGFKDLAITSGDDRVSVLEGNGDGSFHSGGGSRVGLHPHGITSCDVNGDGYQDLAIANDSNVSLLLNDKSGRFQTFVEYPAGQWCRSVAAGDFNADGFDDLSVANAGDGTLGILLWSGNATLAPMQAYSVAPVVYSVDASDLNNDGILDVVGCSIDANLVGVLIGKGDGIFFDSRNFNAGSRPYRIATADLNNDGKIDIAVVSPNAKSVSILLNTTK